jgi:hypothetical protein
MQAAGRQRAVETLAEIERLTEAQHDAAAAGRIAEVAGCLQRRQGLLAQLHEEAIAPERLRAVAARDAETMGILRISLQHLGGELGQLRDGGRALQGYRVRVQSSPGFMDQVQ